MTTSTRKAPAKAPRRRSAASKPQTGTGSHPAASEPLEGQLDVLEAIAEAQGPADELPEPKLIYVAARRMSRNGETIKVGQVIPDAESWPRLESWLRAGYVREMQL